MYVCVIERERKRERQTERQRDRERESERERERETERQREIQNVNFNRCWSEVVVKVTITLIKTSQVVFLLKTFSCQVHRLFHHFLSQ